MTFVNLKRPKLNTFNLKEVKKNIPSGFTEFFVTMSVGQWDSFLEEAYYHQGAVLIELDEKEQLIATYKYII